MRHHNLVFEFGNYKNRGLVVLAMGTTAELIEKLEDSQMALGSMVGFSRIRYFAFFYVRLYSHVHVQRCVVRVRTLGTRRRRLA